jgi:hypothetical protein
MRQNQMALWTMNQIKFTRQQHPFTVIGGVNMYFAVQVVIRTDDSCPVAFGELQIVSDSFRSKRDSDPRPVTADTAQE